MASESDVVHTSPIPDGIPKGSQSFSALFVIILASLLVAAVSYSVQQYVLHKDIAAGEVKRIADQREQSQGQSDVESEQEKKYIEAQRHLAQVLSDSLQRNPSDTSIVLALGSARIAIGDTVGALKMYEKYVTSINPTNMAAMTDYGYLLFTVGRTDDGRRLTLNVLKKQPKNQIALYNLAAMSYKQANLSEALSWMQKCVEADSASQISSMARMAIEQLSKEIAKK